MKRFCIDENDIQMIFEVSDNNQIKLLHFSSLPLNEADFTEPVEEPFTVAELQVSGLNKPGQRFGTSYVRTGPGSRLIFKDFIDRRNDIGRAITVVTMDDPDAEDCTALEVHSHYQFYNGISVVRAWTEVINKGNEACGLEYVSSFALAGVEKEGLGEFDKKLTLWIPHNSWAREMHWNTYTFAELGMSMMQRSYPHNGSSNAVEVSNTGNWSTKEYLPMGYLQNSETNSGLFWQIEHNGSWHWEISEQSGYLNLRISGPTEHQSHWWKELSPGESFVTVPVSVGACSGGFDEAMSALTIYRRAIRRKNADNDSLAVIFNDYMNCLYGDPTTEKELPLIDKAAEAGCEYFCVDCGWYSDGPWWDGVGEWLPAKGRFPGGLKEVMDYIRSKGMVPGAWLELEVMGIKCPKADKVPDDWYFTRHGKKVMDKSRYQLDFRNPQVITHADEVIDRLVNEYGVGYIKMDYNIEPGIGTELGADSYGDGLLGHNRAYLKWLDSVFEKYPDLIIENCSSGGMRIDYAMLSRHSIQSTSDQEDYMMYATIAANSPSALTPEQAAIWSYPLTDGDEEEVAFNMVNALLLRIHQSGHLVNLSPQRLALVQEGIACYKAIRQDIRNAVPVWPLGISNYGDEWASMGLRVENKTYVAVWRRNSQLPTVELPLAHLSGTEADVRCIYPVKGACDCRWNKEAGILTVSLPNAVSARLFLVESK